ncbi:MAG: recombinase family protein [Hyphomonadaceae bacterium]|nr:recombinase family protein [Hyphomonadaceae bacterium]
MRAAIYARYSSDLQSRASIEDQIRLAREHAMRQGWAVAEIYTDYGISGASMMRPGLQALMADAQLRKFDIVLSEALDRISRDQGDTANIHKRMRFHGIKIYTLSEGWVDMIQVGFKGMMNQMFLTELASKVRRGQRGRVENGKIAAGLGYGYEVVREFDVKGEPIRGERRIKPDEAAIVVRIFEEFASGRTAKAIAKRLNEDGVRSPSGSGWSYSSILGNRKRGTGIVNNEMYVGRIVWNRVREDRDPDTHQRIVRVNPQESWIVHKAEHLRIVEQSLWDRVKAQQDRRVAVDGAYWKHRPVKYLISGIVQCGVCGGAYTKYARDHFRCSTYQNKRLCSNRLAMSHKRLEEVIFTGLRNYLLDPELLDVFGQEYARELAAARKEQRAKRGDLEQELARVVAKRNKLIDVIGTGAVEAAEVKPDLDAAIQRRDAIQAELARGDSEPKLIEPGMSERYRAAVAQFIGGFADEETQEEAMRCIRGLIEKIVVRPNAEGDDLDVDLHGALATILMLSVEDESRSAPQKQATFGAKRRETRSGIRKSNQRIDRNSAALNPQLKHVSQAGLEPATRPL